MTIERQCRVASYLNTASILLSSPQLVLHSAVFNLCYSIYSAAAAYERLASAITIAEELQLGATRPELPLSPTLRNVRFIYYNPVDCSLKVLYMGICAFLC